MNCRQVEALLHGHADDQLDTLRGRSIECTCVAAPHARRSATRSTAAHAHPHEVPRYVAPDSLRARVRAMADAVDASSAPRPAPRRERMRWLGGGVLAGCAASALAWTLGTTLLVARASDQFAVAAVTTHVRATLDDRLIAVASSDQHTVKPWLSARLDYSPPVEDLADEGFPLIGGRLERLDGRDVATLVYRYRRHTIDVFVRPHASRAWSVAPHGVRGFNVAGEQGPTMDWLAVSDAEPEARARARSSAGARRRGTLTRRIAE